MEPALEESLLGLADGPEQPEDLSVDASIYDSDLDVDVTSALGPGEQSPEGEKHSFVRTPSKDPTSPGSTKDGGGTLGVVNGVFFPCVQNILGIILFIRVPFITGSAGILVATAIVGCCCLTTFLTSLSISALSTIGRVPAGGPYYILSRAVGPEFGGSVIFFFYLGTSVASAMYIVGAVGVVQDNIPAVHPGFWLSCDVCQADGILDALKDPQPCVQLPNVTFHCDHIAVPCTYLDAPATSPWANSTVTCVHSYNEVRVFGTVLSLVMAGFVSLGVALVSKIAPYFLYVVLLSILMIYAGMLSTLVPGYRHFDVPGLTGFSMQNFKDNLYPPTNFWDSERDEYSYTFLFGLFFPSCTGIMAGCNRSGDLKNASKDIPRGTIAATLFTSAIYLSQLIMWGAQGNNDSLRNQQFLSSIVPGIAWPFPQLVAGAMLLSSVGAGLQCLVGAPKLLKTMADDKILVFLNCVADPSPERPRDPRWCLLVTWCISFLCIMIAKLQEITSIITMFYLICYLGINLSLTIVSGLDMPSFRTSFRCFHWTQSLLGMLLCIFIMIMTSPLYMVIVLGLCSLLYMYIARSTLPEWARDDASRAAKFRVVRKALHKMERANIAGNNAYTNPGARNWRPQVLVVVKAQAGARSRSLGAWKMGDKKAPKEDEESTECDIHNLSLFAFTSHLKHGHGLTIIGSVICAADRSFAAKQKNELDLFFNSLMRKGKMDDHYGAFEKPWPRGYKAFTQIVTTDTIARGEGMLIQTAGLGSMIPNTVVARFSEFGVVGAGACDSVALVNNCIRSEKSVLFLKDDQMLLPRNTANGCVRGDTIDLWTTSWEGGFLLMIPYILQRHKLWSRSSCRVFILTDRSLDANKIATLKAEANAKLDDFRLPQYEVHVRSTQDPRMTVGSPVGQSMQTPLEIAERTNQLIRQEYENVQQTRLVLVNMPNHPAIIAKGTEEDSPDPTVEQSLSFMALMATLTQGLDPVLIGRNTAAVVTSEL